MSLKESPNWTQRETTEPQQMVASLRYATRVQSEQGAGSFTFPYHKKMDGLPYYVHVRTRTHPFPPYDPYKFCLDVGMFSDPEKKDVFISSAWVDVDIKDHLSLESLKHLPTRWKRIGIINTSHHIMDRNLEIRRPSDMRLNWGIFVEQPLRRHKVATSLITAARIVLDHFNVETLIISGIRHIEEGHPSGGFYHALGGYIFGRNRWRDSESSIEGISGKVALPTKETDLRPYRFE